MLDPNRWTLKTREAFNHASGMAQSKSHPEVTPDHLLLALIGQADGVVLPVLQRTEVALPELRRRLEADLGGLPSAYGTEVRTARDLVETMETADAARVELGDEYLSTEHLLLALSEQVGVGRDELLKALAEVRGSHRVTSTTPEDS